MRSFAATLIVFPVMVFADSPPPVTDTLKDAFRDDFLLGVAVAASLPDEPARVDLVTRQFNTLTAENAMKPGPLQPREGEFRFAPADRLLALGEAHGMKIIGHTLVWHQQTPEWFFQNADGTPASREKVLERLRSHILTVAGHYRGRIHGWDVVNEALSDGKEMFRSDSPWMKSVGPEFIEHAFRWAAEADPGAELYYNDYNIEQPEKLRKTLALVKDLQAKGVRIDGVGIQGHWGLEPPVKDLDAAITALSALGVKVMVTELDINVLPGRPAGADVSERADWQAKLDPYVHGCPPEVLAKQAAAYARVFAVLKKHRDVVSRVTFWCTDDGNSWLNNWPIKGRTNYPLLFDRQLQPKPAFAAVLEVARGSAGADVKASD